MSFVSEQFGEDQIESPSNLRPGFHGRAEARRRRTRALHRDDEFVGTAVRVCRIAELVLEQNSVLHGDSCQFACADSQKCKRMFGLRLAIQDPEGLFPALGRAESHLCRVEIFLPALWSHREAKEGLVFALHQPVMSRFLHIGPTDR